MVTLILPPVTHVPHAVCYGSFTLRPVTTFTHGFTPVTLFAFLPTVRVCVTYRTTAFTFTFCYTPYVTVPVWLRLRSVCCAGCSFTRITLRCRYRLIRSRWLRYRFCWFRYVTFVRVTLHTLLFVLVDVVLRWFTFVCGYFTFARLRLLLFTHVCYGLPYTFYVCVVTAFGYVTDVPVVGLHRLHCWLLIPVYTFVPVYCVVRLVPVYRGYAFPGYYVAVTGWIATYVTYTTRFCYTRFC